MSGTALLDSLTPAPPTPGMVAAGSYPIVSPHPAPDNPDVTTNLSDADYAAFKAGKQPGTPTGKGGANTSVLDSLPAALPTAGQIAAQGGSGQSTWGGAAQNFAAGGNQTIFGALGAPVDLLTGAINNLGQGPPRLPTIGESVQQSTGYGGDQPPPTERLFPTIQNPFGGSQSLEQLWGRVTGINPANVQPTGGFERAARAAGGAIAQVPLMALGGGALEAGATGVPAAVGGAIRTASGTTGPMVAKVATSAAAGGAGGQVAEDATPAPYKPLANIAGNLAGAGGTLGAIEGVGAGGRQVSSALGLGGKQTIAGIRATPGQIAAAAADTGNAVGQEGKNIIARSVANEEEARDLEAQIANDQTPSDVKQAAQTRLNQIQGRRVNLVPQQTDEHGNIIPSGPTTAQLAGSGGTLEKALRVANPDPFLARDAAQNNARVASINAVQPEGVPTSVGEHFTAMLDGIETKAAQDAAAARGGVQGATEGLGGAGAPSAIGADVRAPLMERDIAAKERASNLWKAIDPEGKLAMPLTGREPTEDIPFGGLRETAGGLLDEVNPDLGDTIDPKVEALLKGVKNLPDVIPFRDGQRIRTNIGNAERRLRKDPGNDADLRRLAIMKASFDDTTAAAADTAASTDPGVAARLDAMAGEEGRGSVAGGPGGPGNAPGAAGGTAGIPGEGRGAGAGAARRGNAPGAGAVATPRATRTRKPESLVDWIISKGGMQDPGGDVRAMGGDMVHHQKGGRLLNPNGRYPDYVREGAVEEGFLKPGADINDLYSGINEELAGNPVYRQHEEAEGHAWQTQQAEAERSAHAYQMAVGQVEDALPHGSTMPDDERDFAARLILDGQHPEEAIRNAVGSREEADLQRNAEALAAGRPGLAPGAQQAEMPVGRAQLRPNFDADAAGRYAAARAATLERKTTFGQGPVGKVLQPGRLGAEHAVEDADATAKFLSRQPTEPDNVAKYIAAVGGDAKAVGALREGLVADLRNKGIIQPDGTLDGGRFAQWQQRRGRTIEQFPGLKEQFQNAAAAQRTLDTVTAEGAQRVKDFQNGVAKNFLHDEPAVAVRKAFASGNPEATFKQLADLVKGNPDAEAGLRRAVVDHIIERTRGATPTGDTTDMLKADVFRRFLRQNTPALRQLFGGQGIQRFDAVAAELRRAAQRTTATAGSDTAANQQSIVRRGLSAVGQHGATAGLTLMALLGEHLGDIAGGHGLIGAAAAFGGAKVVTALRQAGIDTKNQLVAAAMLDPRVFQILQEKAASQGAGAVSQQRRLGSALLAAAAGNVSSKEKERVQ